jgi:hypothetical protein
MAVKHACNTSVAATAKISGYLSLNSDLSPLRPTSGTRNTQVSGASTDQIGTWSAYYSFRPLFLLLHAGAEGKGFDNIKTEIGSYFHDSAAL